MESYKKRINLDGLLHAAGQALDKNGKLHKHQRRPVNIYPDVLNQLETVLFKNKDWFAEFKGLNKDENSFEVLYQKIDEVTRKQDINGCGALMLYDTTLRIGEGVNVFPVKRLYIQQGAKEGFDYFLEWRGNPREEHLENFLCHFKNGKHENRGKAS